MPLTRRLRVRGLRSTDTVVSLPSTKSSRDARGRLELLGGATSAEELVGVTETPLAIRRDPSAGAACARRERGRERLPSTRGRTRALGCRERPRRRRRWRRPPRSSRGCPGADRRNRPPPRPRCSRRVGGADRAHARGRQPARDRLRHSGNAAPQSTVGISSTAKETASCEASAPRARGQNARAATGLPPAGAPGQDRERSQAGRRLERRTPPGRGRRPSTSETRSAPSEADQERREHRREGVGRAAEDECEGASSRSRPSRRRETAMPRAIAAAQPEAARPRAGGWLDGLRARPRPQREREHASARFRPAATQTVARTPSAGRSR